MPSIATLAAKYGVGRGTVQAALDLLRIEAALEIATRGPAASVLAACDRGRLWQAVGRRGLMLLLPLPYSLRVMGLATALARTLRGCAVSHSLAYMRGARSRLEALAEGRADLAVTSRLAADEALAVAGLDVEILLRLGPETYAGAQGWLVREGFEFWPEHPLIGVDLASADQSLAPREAAACGVPSPRWVEVPYLRWQAAVASGEVDAVLWPLDVVPSHTGLKVHPTDLVSHLMPRMGEAVLLVRRGDEAVRSLLAPLLQAATLRAIQVQVMEGRMEPTE